MKIHSFCFKIIGVVVGIGVLFWLPWLYAFMQFRTHIVSDFSLLQKADAALIFGANLKEDGTLSEITADRVEAGIFLYKLKIVDELVPSNTQTATEAMSKYLLANNVSFAAIIKDDEAETTSDTCKREKFLHPEGRKVIFLSQSYHLPRILLLCHNLGVEGIGYGVENLEGLQHDSLSFYETSSIRIGRYSREALLSWPAILNIRP